MVKTIMTTRIINNMNKKVCTLSKTKRIALVIALPLILIIIGLVYVYLQTQGIIQFECIIHKLTGLSCPSCGGTRMVYSLLNLEIYQAFRYNSFIFISIPYIMYIYIDWGYEYIKHNRQSSKTGRLLIILFTCIVVFGVLRNIPYFNFLLPVEL